MILQIRWKILWITFWAEFYLSGGKKWFKIMGEYIIDWNWFIVKLLMNKLCFTSTEIIGPPNKFKCTFPTLSLSSFLIFLSWVGKPRLVDLNRKILSANTQHRSVERDVIHFGLVPKDSISYWATSRLYPVSTVTEDHTRQIGCLLSMYSLEVVRAWSHWSVSLHYLPITVRG